MDHCGEDTLTPVTLGTASRLQVLSVRAEHVQMNPPLLMMLNIIRGVEVHLGFLEFPFSFQGWARSLHLQTLLHGREVITASELVECTGRGLPRPSVYSHSLRGMDCTIPSD